MTARIALLALALAACGDDGASQPTIELGTGGPTQFDDLGEGSTLQLAQGCQGLQHVWLSVRIRGLDPSRGLIEGRLLRTRDQALVSFELELSLPFMPVENAAELRGLQLIIPEAEPVLEEDLVLIVRVTDPANVSAERILNVRIEWGDERCETQPPNNPDGGADADAGAFPDAINDAAINDATAIDAAADNRG